MDHTLPEKPVPPRQQRRELFDYQPVSRHNRTMILAAMLLYSVISYLLISRFVIGTVVVQGPSMEPTLEAGQRLLVHRWFYLLRTPQRGDIVALRLPGEHAQLVKRVVALPLETIRIERGRVFVNGDALQEPYLHGAPTSGGPLGTNTYRIADDCYFVLGDNRANSSDSRAFGAVPHASIIGMIRQ
jgi:signal peptidase I